VFGLKKMNLEESYQFWSLIIACFEESFESIAIDNTEVSESFYSSSKSDILENLLLGVLGIDSKSPG